MDKTYCYVAQKGFDDVIANSFPGWNERGIALLRGAYDSQHEDAHIDTNDIPTAIQKLKEFKKEQARKRAEEIHSAGTNLADSFIRLKEAYSGDPTKRNARISMIASMFSNLLDEMHTRLPNVSRKQLCNGVEVKGIKRGGATLIFENIYRQMVANYTHAQELNNLYEEFEYREILRNWPAIVALVKLKLRDIEELKIGNTTEYAEDTYEDNFEDNILSQLYDVSESTREGWQELADARSSYASLSKDVRKFLARMPVDGNEEGEDYKRDDLGYEVYHDPVSTHQRVLKFLRGMKTSNDMMEKFRKAQMPFYNRIYRELINNPRLRTQFFVDFKKNFQQYSNLKVTKKGKLRRFSTPSLNKKRKALFNAYMTKLTLGKSRSANLNLVYKNDGNINWRNLRTLRGITKEWFAAEGAIAPSKFWAKTTDNKTKLAVLDNITTLLGIDIDVFTLDAIINNKKLIYKFTNNLRDLVYKGLEGHLTKEELNTLDLNDDEFNDKVLDLKDRNWKELIKTQYANSNSKQGTIEEKLSKAFSVLEYYQENKIEDRVRVKNAKGDWVTMYSDVYPSYLGDTIDMIKSFVAENNKEGLKIYLEEYFLNSSYYRTKDGVIRNWWLKELYEEACNKEKDFNPEGLAANIDFKRFMGTNDTAFENFTSKQHALEMIAEYRDGNGDYRNFPIFILGDSGTSKFIRARRYNIEATPIYEKDKKTVKRIVPGIIDGMYDIYLQEIERFKLTESVNKKLKEDGYSLIGNFSKKGEIFTILPFLNKDFVASDGTIGKYACDRNTSETDVKNAIRSYMEDAYEVFKKEIGELGVLETTKIGDKEKYVYLDQYIGKNQTVDDVLEDYYWNTKFATIQQLQIFTVDTAFYESTKDLQKRYKEIHAPGSLLDIYATTMTGERYSNDGIETCVYFDDINLNAEETDPKFMEAIAYQYGKDMLKNENASREEIIKAGKKSWQYNKYKKNTLTDGQGYRSLDGYRKVLGMSGQWTEEMEDLYKYIKEVRAKYGRNNIPQEILTEISDRGIIFQPIKPYLYTKEKYAINSSNCLYIPVQHKYAEVVLIPELLKDGSKLKELAIWMEDHVDENGKNQPIDVVCSTKCVKVGSFGSVNISKVSNKEELSAALNKAYTHQLSYSDYRIQTNVPEHVNSSQLFGTQIRKLIMSNLKMDDYHYENYVNKNLVNLGGNVGKVRLNGKNLNSFYNSLIVANILDCFESVAKEFNDPEKLSQAFIQNIISNSRESTDNIIAYSLTNNADFLMPLFEGALEHDSSALLFSMFKNRVNKQKIKGGSAVQVSAMGIQGFREDENLQVVIDPANPNNILYAECEIPWDLTYTDAQGNTVELNYEDYCNTDGSLKKDGKGNVILEKEFPHILDIVAYRIPTEKEYSMINLKIARFSHKTAGGTIKVPSQYSTIAGFDFDIDKLYFMRHDHREKELEQEEVKKIWDAVYEANPDIKNALKEKRNSEDWFNTIFKLFDHSKLAQNIVEDSESKDRLYKFWEEAGLKGTPADFFKKFMKDNPDILRKIRNNKIKFEEYDYTKTPLENSISDRNNMILNIMRQRLMDEETMKARYTPGGFVNASGAARIQRELEFGDLEGIVSHGIVDFNEIEKRASIYDADPEPNYDPSDPMTIVRYNQQNQAAGKLIGVFANHNTNHAFSSLMKSFTLKKGIAFAGHSEEKDLLHKDNPLRLEEIDINVAEYLAASVDAVKDPVLNYLNLNTITADAGALLVRLGYNTTEIGMLFNQPIIKEICTYSQNNNVSVDIAIKEITENAYGAKNIKKLGDTTESDVSMNRLALNIINARKARENGTNLKDNTDFIENQLKVARLFNQIASAAKDVNNFITATKFTAANSVGSTFGDMYAQQMKVNNYLDKFITNSDGVNALQIEMNVTDNIEVPINNANELLLLDKQSYMDMLLNNPFAFEQAMFDMNRLIIKALKKYYPYENYSYKNARTRLTALSKNNYLDANTINSMHSEILVYMLNSRRNSLLNPETILSNGMSARDYYTKEFPMYLYSQLNENNDLFDNELLKLLQFDVDDNKNVTISINEIGGLKSEQKDELKNEWERLLYKNPKLATDLFIYTFFIAGFNYNSNSIMTLAPNKLKESVIVGEVFDQSLNDGEGGYREQSYVEFLKDVLAGEDFNIEDFIKQYILNHTDNEKLVFTPKGTLKSNLKQLIYKEGVAQNEFTINLNTPLFKGDSKFYLLKDNSLNEKFVAFRPCIVVDGMTYICDSGNQKFNITAGGSMTYRRVEPLGSKGLISYYSDYQIVTNTKSSENSSENETDLTDEGTTGTLPDSSDYTKVYSIEEAVNKIVTEMVRGRIAIGLTNRENEADHTEVLTNLFMAQEKSEIYQTLKELMEDQILKDKTTGILILDENGNMQPAC